MDVGVKSRRVSSVNCIAVAWSRGNGGERAFLGRFGGPEVEERDGIESAVQLVEAGLHFPSLSIK